ncbi:MAG: hypothetical protein LQ351_001735 [Letrouitia transgressa]|nr:MAG: hypothetical protein LQ351_001735 [Letrouitia transgressa]
MAYQRPVNSGSLGLSPFIAITPVPTILAEWAALIPLICHLAGYDEDPQMVGELALTGHLVVEVFPKLGLLNGIRKLLEGGADFLDRANVVGSTSSKIWDVNWGSTFPCANGVATAMVTEYALNQRRHNVVQGPVNTSAVATDVEAKDPKSTPTAKWPELDIASTKTLSETLSSKNVEKAVPKRSTAARFRRYQTLHIIQVARKSNHSRDKSRIPRYISSRVSIAASVIIPIGVTVLLGLLGAYGTAAVLLSGALSKLVCRLLQMDRPSGFLENNEDHNGCMLRAAHDNASTWYLYVGDRGPIDGLLNKTMLSLPGSSKRLAIYFRLAHLFQLLAMTFVAAQKGIDGICLVILMVASYALRLLSGKQRIAKQWLEANGVRINAHTFEFGGRVAMIGAIHLLNGSKNPAWMDGIIVPCARRNAWLSEINPATQSEVQHEETLRQLSPSDQSWVQLQSRLTREAAKMIDDTLKKNAFT